MNPEAQTLEVTLRRAGKSIPWGFRMQGGTDFDIPLSVILVNPGSVAENGGLAPGDAILRIADNATELLTHDDAKSIVVNSENECKLLVQRGKFNIWKPKVTPLAELRCNKPEVLPDYGDDDGLYVQKTSLAANKQDFDHIGGSHNLTAKGFDQGQSAFMSENAIYSYNTIADVPATQSYTPPPMFISTKEDVTSKPSGFKSVRAPVAKDPSEIKEVRQMACHACGKVCAGVFVRIRGNPYHPECFTCAICNHNLKNYGHFEVGGKLYCESCVDGA